MGVSGCGKTTIGKAIATELDIAFYDADEFHPPANIKKMASGKPLTDLDRHPWLTVLAHKIAEWNSQKGAVLGCSALKQTYRDLLSSFSDENKICFIYLKGTYELMYSRLTARTGHFFPPELLRSQFETLEEPKNAITFDAGLPSDIIIEKIMEQLNPDGLAKSLS